MNSKKLPARSHMTFDKDTFEYLKTALAENKITYMPMTKQAEQSVNAYHQKLGLQPIQVDSIKHVVLNIRRQQLTFIDDNGMLRSIDIHENDLQKVTQTHGLKLFQYTKEQLKTADPYAYARFSSKLSHAQKQDVLIRLPDVINGTPVDAREIKRVLRDIPMSKINSNQPVQWDKKNPRERHIGNNIAEYGVTVEQYIQIRYAYVLIKAFHENSAFLTQQIEQKEYKILSDKFLNEYDNWSEDRIHPDKKSVIPTPNPDAYDVLTKINRPAFERTPENKKKNTFDRIRITMGIKSKESMPGRTDFIKSQKREIVKIALLKIEQHPYFERYGVPIQYIKPVSMTVTRTDEIEIIFELK